MVIAEWIFAGEDTDIKVSGRKQIINAHFITNQGTLIVSLSPEQAVELKKLLSKKELG